LRNLDQAYQFIQEYVTGIYFARGVPYLPYLSIFLLGFFWKRATINGRDQPCCKRSAYFEPSFTIPLSTGVLKFLIHPGPMVIEHSPTCRSWSQA
jgi:hypothetical protein